MTLKYHCVMKQTDTYESPETQVFLLKPENHILQGSPAQARGNVNVEDADGVDGEW